MTEMIFATKLWNRTKQHIIPVFDHQGTCLSELVPGAEMTLQTKNPNTLYTRWTEVQFKEGGVEFTDRLGFVEPDLGRWTLIMLNLYGRPCEVRYVGGVMEKVEEDAFGRTQVVMDFLGRPVQPMLKERRKGGRPVHLPRGIPVRVGIPVTDELAPYERLEIKVVEEMRPRVMVKNYLEMYRSIKDVLIPRSAKELHELQEELDRLMLTQQEATA